METITIDIRQGEVYGEVAKATDYTGSKMENGDEKTRDRILAGDEDFKELGRFWDETIAAFEEFVKELLVGGETDADNVYHATIEVSRSWDTSLKGSVQSTLRSYFIASIIGQWFKFANKGEANEYITSAADMLLNVERLLYTRRRPQLPQD